MNAFFADNAMIVLVVSLFFNAIGWVVLEQYAPEMIETSKQFYGKYYGLAVRAGWLLVIVTSIFVPVWMMWMTITSIPFYGWIIYKGIKKDILKQKTYEAMRPK